MLTLFLNQLPSTIAALGGAMTERDWMIAAHTLKGSGRAVGAWRIARIAEQAERSDFIHRPELIAETMALLEDGRGRGAVPSSPRLMVDPFARKGAAACACRPRSHRQIKTLVVPCGLSCEIARVA